MHRPANRQQLWGFVFAHFGVALPHRTFTRGHSTPLDFVADAFFNPAQDIAAWACRSGGKTLGASIIAALEFLFTDCLQARVLSGSEAQARNLYEYWRRWCGALLTGRVEGEVKRQLTRVAGGRLEVLAASQKNVRGPKVHRLFEDELDEIDREIDAAAVGMIVSRESIPGRTIYTSTWHRADGPMAHLVGAAPTSGVRLHKWNLWEAIQRCQPDRHQNGAGCKHCGLGEPCRAKAIEAAISTDPDRSIGIAAEATGLYAIDDAIKAYSKISQDTWDAEFECKRPRPEGLVYANFDETAHRCENPPSDLRIFRTIDWGHGVFVCLWIGEDKNGSSYLLDTYRSECGTIHQHAKYILKHELCDVAATYCDPAGRNRSDQTGRSNIQLFADYGIRCTYSMTARAREVRNGIELVRAALRPAAGEPRLFYLPRDNNRIFVKAMQSYRNRRVNGTWIDEPRDPQEFEHIPDALRYYFVNRCRSGLSVVRLGAS